jgi:hypothetical protein
MGSSAWWVTFTASLVPGVVGRALQGFPGAPHLERPHGPQVVIVLGPQARALHRVWVL